jgi:nucleoside 2-deoxyribosyltransferase
MVIYIAGPFRAKTPWLVEENIRLAERTAIRVALAGHIPLCPHTMYRFFDGSAPDEFWLEGTQELLRRCDGIVMSTGWPQSSGSQAELGLAQARRMPVWMSIEEFETWAEGDR